MSRWFRHYAGMMRDEKLVRVAVRSNQPVERVVWVWGAILESASEINDNGRYEFDCGEAAYFLRCNDADLAGILSSLESLGRIVGGVVARWGDRQYSSDTAAERQRRYRERRKAGDHVQESNGERDSDASVTSRDGQVTLQETDTEVETERKKDSPSLRSGEGAREAKRPSRLAGDWSLPDDWRQDALDAGLPHQRIEVEAANMRDWSRSAPKGAKLDWRAAWRNWCRRAAAELPPAARAGPSTRPPNALDILRQQRAPDAQPTPERPRLIAAR